MCEVVVCRYGGRCVHFYREVDAYLYDFRGKVDLSPAGGEGGLLYHF